jgi:glycosyltransferase involved in cell wall biosynthesis
MTKLSVIIPVYNEEAHVEELLRRVLAVEGIHKEIIAVDDGSKDGSFEILSRLAEKNDMAVLRHEQNRGKGAAIATALTQASGDLVIIQDADLEYDPAEYPRLVEPILSGRADVVFGSRILGGMRGHYWRFYYGGRLVTWLGNWLFGTRLTDLPTGYKVMHMSVVRDLKLSCRGFAFCAEVFAQIAQRKLCIEEVPISYHARTFREGKKITAWSGLSLFGILLRYRLP